MKRTVFAVALIVALTACTTTGDGIHPRSGNFAYVYVVAEGEKLYAYPEVVTVHNRNTRIVWRLAVSDPKHKFPADAIVIEDKEGEFDDCKANKNGKKEDDYTFVCLDKKDNPNGRKHPRHYKYTIKVDGAKPLDPWVVND